MQALQFLWRFVKSLHWMELLSMLSLTFSPTLALCWLACEVFGDDDD